MEICCGSTPVSLRLLLVRHGLSSFNLEQRIQGRDDLSDHRPVDGRAAEYPNDMAPKSGHEVGEHSDRAICP